MIQNYLQKSILLDCKRFKLCFLLLVSFFVAPVSYGQVEVEYSQYYPTIYDNSSYFKDLGSFANSSGSGLKGSKVLPIKSTLKQTGALTVSSIDLNGPTPGVNHEVMVNAAGTLYPMCTFYTEIITTNSTATSARITFSANTNGVPAGVPNAANEFFFVYNTAGTNLGNYQISVTSATTFDIVVGTNTLRIAHGTANVFDITEVFGQPILVDNLEILLRSQLYRHTNPAIGDTRRYAVISVTDPNNTLSAYTNLSTGSDPVAVDDTNSVAANSGTAVTGNLTTNDTDATAGDARTITEVHGYTSFVGAAYTTTLDRKSVV